MPYFSFDDIHIAGISAAVPKQIVLTDDFIPQFGETSVEKIKKTVGIIQSHRSEKNQTASDLGFAAAEELLNKFDIGRSSIDALVFVSHSMDYKRPATSCVLQKRLGLSNECAVFDIGMGCTGFVYAMQIVASCMRSSDITRALIISAETSAKNYSMNDRTLMLMGDAGSAVLLEKKGGAPRISGVLKSHGDYYQAIMTPAGASRHPDEVRDPFLCRDGVERSFYDTFMNGRDVYSFTIFEVPALIKEFFAKTGTAIDNYDSFVFHQANADMLRQFSKRLDLPLEKMPISIDRYGNTTCPSIPLTICDAYGGRESCVSRLLMCGFGSGLSLGAVSAEVDTKNILPVIETDDHYIDGENELGLL